MSKAQMPKAHVARVLGQVQTVILAAAQLLSAVHLDRQNLEDEASYPVADGARRTQFACARTPHDSFSFSFSIFGDLSRTCLGMQTATRCGALSTFKLALESQKCGDQESNGERPLELVVGCAAILASYDDPI